MLTEQGPVFVFAPQASRFHYSSRFKTVLGPLSGCTPPKRVDRVKCTKILAAPALIISAVKVVLLTGCFASALQIHAYTHYCVAAQLVDWTSAF